MKTKPEAQVEYTIKLLLALLAEPKIPAATLGKSLGLTENFVNQMMMRFRNAGLEVEYDFGKAQYRLNFSNKLNQKLESYANRLKAAIESAPQPSPQVKFVQSLDRYSVKQFADMLGGTPSNVYNMISGYKGAKLPAGWCAYQIASAGKWWIVKMARNAADTKWEIPAVARDAHSIVVGEGEPKTEKEVLEESRCIVRGCKAPAMARGFCYYHYYDARRNPDKYLRPRGDAPWPPGTKRKPAA
jgi:biotin operon repressor